MGRTPNWLSKKSPVRASPATLARIKAWKESNFGRASMSAARSYNARTSRTPRRSPPNQRVYFHGYLGNKIPPHIK